MTRSLATMLLICVVSSCTPGIAQEVDRDMARIMEVLVGRESEPDNSIYEKVVELNSAFKKGETDEDTLEASLKLELEKHFDDYKKKAGDPERLSNHRESFIDDYLAMLMYDVRGETVPEMESAAFLECCNELNLHLAIDYTLAVGAPLPNSRLVVLSLPKMDCGGCAQRVKDKLAELEGVTNIETSVPMAGCQFLVPTEINIREALDEFATTTVQFEEWSVKQGPLIKPDP